MKKEFDWKNVIISSVIPIFMITMLWVGYNSRNEAMTFDRISSLIFILIFTFDAFMGFLFILKDSELTLKVSEYTESKCIFQSALLILLVVVFMIPFLLLNKIDATEIFVLSVLLLYLTSSIVLLAIIKNNFSWTITDVKKISSMLLTINLHSRKGKLDVKSQTGAVYYNRRKIQVSEKIKFMLFYKNNIEVNYNDGNT